MFPFTKKGIILASLCAAILWINACKKDPQPTTGTPAFKQHEGTLFEQESGSLRTKDGSFVVLGTANGSQSLFVSKINIHGDLVWEQILSDYQPGSTAQITEAADGSLYISGTKGTQSIILTKFNAAGQLQWFKEFDEVGEFRFPQLIDATADGNIVICGSTESSLSPDGTDVLIFKIDNAGNQLWSNTIEISGTSNPFSMLEMSDGDIIVSGFHNFGFSTAPFVYRISKTGAVLMKKMFPINSVFTLSSLVEIPGGDVVACGSTNQGFVPQIGLFRLEFVGKDSLKNATLIAEMGYPEIAENSLSITPLPDGTFIITGFGDNNQTGLRSAVVLRTNIKGEKIWYRNFGSNTGTICTGNNSFVEGSELFITGNRQVFQPAFEPRYYLLKMDIDGNFK